MSLSSSMADFVPCDLLLQKANLMGRSASLVQSIELSSVKQEERRFRSFHRELRHMAQ